MYAIRSYYACAVCNGCSCLLHFGTDDGDELHQLLIGPNRTLSEQSLFQDLAVCTVKNGLLERIHLSLENQTGNLGWSFRKRNNFV